MRQIILDTETTGLRVEDGHRIIELGCVEMINRRLTGNQLHHYLYPGREVEAGAMAVHGISNEFLRDKPSFDKIVHEFIQFIDGAELIIHNAPFDLGFLNNELKLQPQPFKLMTDYCKVIDTLPLARQLHVGQRNSLDALCKRYGIDNSKREMHGALLDAHLLAQVYLAMTGGQGSFFDGFSNEKKNSKSTQASPAKSLDGHQLVIIKADENESKEHDSYLESMKKKGKCYWLDA